MIWKKIVSVLLFAVVLLSLFSGWIGLGAGARGLIFQSFGSEMAFTDELETILYNVVEEIESAASYQGIFFDAVKLVKSVGVIFAALVDLRLAPSEIGSVCSNLSSLLTPMLQASYSEDAAIAVNAIKAMGAVSTGYFIVMLVLLVLIFILSFTSKKNVCGLHIVAMIMTVLQFAIMGAVVLVCNTFLAEELFYDMYNPKLLSLTIWPYIAVVCSIAGLIFYSLSRKKKPVPAVVSHRGTYNAVSALVAAPAAADAWICEVCGAKNSGAFCQNCGAKKPLPPPPAAAEGDEWICPSCGTKCDGSFCSECGSRKPQAAQKRFCTRCGKELAEGAIFCTNCGTKFE